LRDSSGLVVRVEPNGRTYFVSIYALRGKRRVVLHGDYPTTSLADARAAHAALLAAARAARRGTAPDPAAKSKANTVRELATLYLDLHAKPHKRTWKADQRILNTDVLPHIGELPLTQLHRRDVQGVLDRIDRRGAHNQSWQTLKIVRRMLSWAVSRGELDINPATGIERQHRYTPRQRVLSDAELTKLLPWLRTIPYGLGGAAELSLFTACRPGEARLLRWEHINGAEWLLPAELAKSGTSRVIPLSTQALAVLRRAPVREGFVFPSHSGAYSLSALGHVLRVHQEKLLELGVAPFTPHDLRRTAATLMRKLGFGLVVDRVLGHAPVSVLDRHYDVHDYLSEKRAALKALGKYLENLQ